MLKTLAFDLAAPTALSFLDKYEKDVDIPEELVEKFSYITRVSFLDLINKFLG